MWLLPTDILQAAGAVETGNWQYKQANAAAELRNPQLVGRASSTPLEGTADSKMSQAAEAPGIQESERATGSFRISDRASIQDEKQKCAVEAAVSAVIAAAADGAAEQEQEAPPKTNQEGGRASSVLSSLLSAALRQLLPWVLPCALQGASAADVKVNIAKKQLTLSGISLQPQELTAVTGAPLHLLHCSIGELQLQVGRQEEAGAVEAARNTTVTASNLGSKISEGCASSPVATAAAADGVANFVSREESSSLRISVKDVIVVLAPTSSQEWSRQQLLELALQRRRSLLYNMDSELKQQEVQKQSGFSPCLSSLISHWIDRHIQWASLDLHNLHLRLEFLVPPCNNSSSTGSTAFAFGVHLEEFRMRTLPSEESKDLSACTAHGQQQRSQETVATSPHRVTEAAGESLPNSGTSRNYGFNSQGSVCSEFDIKGCSMYTQNELLLLAPHTRTVVENVERLCAVRAEQQQQDGHPKSQQAEEDQLPPGQNCQMRLDCRLPVSARSLLSPLGIHGFLRKNAVIECPKGNGGRGSSSEALRQGGSRSESDSAVLYVNETTPAAGPAYVASVESDCLEVTFSPGVLRGLRWLTANLEMHSKGVDAAEAILSLVRPFVPSCTVKGNPRIWWRFAIRAICRLQRNGCSSVYTNSSNFAIGAQLGITGDGLAAEESLKLRLCTEKAVTYRRLRLLQLQAMLTERQLDQLLRLRDSIPLPQLLQSHAAARQDFMDQRSKAPGAETTKMWGRWFSIWRKSPLKQGCTTGVNTATGECNAPDDAELRNSYFPRPPLPPLPLHSLLDQHRMERQTHEKSGQQTPQKGTQQQQGQHEQQQTCPEEEACLSGFDDFFDARSQPATARLSGNLRLHVGPGEDSTPGLMLAASKETQQHMQAYEGTTEAEEPFPPYLENRALGGVCTGEGASQEGNGSSAMEFAPAAVAPGATKSNSESTVRREDDLSDSEDTFYDCLDFQPPGPTSLESCAGVALGATSTTSRTSLDRIQSPVNLPATSKQIAYTMEVSVLVRSASIACRLDKLKSSQAESAPERRCSFLKQKQGSQKAVGSVVLCSIGAVRVNGTIGNERFEGGASIDRLDISFNGGGFQDKEKLVFMDRETGNEPLISFHISQNMVSPPSAPIVDDSSGCSQEAEPSSGIRNRQQQLRDGASLRYIVSVEAPTVILPASEGQAILCHLGELRKLKNPKASDLLTPPFRTSTPAFSGQEDRLQRHLLQQELPVLQPTLEQTTGSTTCSKEMQYGENAGSNLRDTEPLPTAWGVCNVVHPVLLPSELAAAVEVEHIDMLAPRLVFPPSKLRQQTRHSPREFRTASFKFHHSQPSAGKGAKLGAGQQEVSHSLPQPKQYQHQEQEELNAHDPQEQRPCEVQIYVNGKCKGIMASLSRRSCAALLSSFESLKTALSGNGVTAVSPGCSSFGSAVKVSSTCAEGSSGWNDGCNSRKAREVDEVSNSIPVYIDASLDNRGCGTACRLEMKQLLLEQPSLPAESINRYIVCVPPLNRSSATEGAAADFSGGPGVQLAFTSGTCTTSAPGAAPTTVSVHVLRPMTLNFRPTALTWVVNFLKAPFGSCVRTRNAGSDGENNSTYYETRMQHNKNNGCAQQFEVEVEAALKSSEGLGSSPEDGAPKPPHVGEVAAELADSWPQGDPVLRGIRVQFQRVNILWCTRGSDKPLATASLSAASVGLDLGRHSTKITGSIRDLTLHFVVPSLISAETAPSVVLPPQDTRVGNISGSQEAPPKLIERSPSLEDIAARAVLQSDAAGEMPASARALHSGVRECTDEGLTSGFDKKLPLIVPNEGLRRIFLLADAGRSVLGLPPLFKESQEGAGVSGGGDTKLHRLVLPQALPFSAFHYEIQITSPRLLLPATCRPNTGVILWPPAFCDGGDLNRDHVACGARYSTTSPAIDRDVGACKRTNYPAGSESSSVREVVCLLDNFKVSNSWNLSREHGVVESINVTFKGAKGFAKLGFPQDFNNLCSRMAAGPADPRCRADSEASYLGGTCRRCARRVPCCRRSSIGESRISCKSPAAATSGDSEATAAPEYPGRYLFGSVDLVIRMLRPLLLRCSSRWLRVEAGLLPLALDVQTLGLLFDIVENNITANDPDTVIENTEKPPPSCTERRAEGFLASKRDARFSVSSSASQDVSGAATPSFQERLSELAQKLLGNHILQGLLEPQVDFIELLEEWGRETLLLELVIEGLHLAVREQPLKNQVLMLREQCGALRRCIRVLECRQGLRKNQSKISRLSAQEGESQRRSVDRLSEVSIPQQTPFLLFHATRLRAQLRSLRLQPEQAEQVGLVLSTAALAPPWTSFVNFGEEQKTVGKTGNPSLISPVTGTFMGMRVGSTTVFSPELVPPFSVVFTDSTCPVGLLQQQLDPIADVLRQAESDAVAAAISIARIDEKLAAQSGLATNSDQKDEDQLKQSDKQLSGSSAQPQCQEEHLLVAPFAAAWVEPLQLQSQTQDSSGDEHELTSRDPVAGSSADVANSGRFPLPRSGTFTLRSNSAEATSASPFEVPACSRDYEVVFRCCQKTRQQHRMMKPTVPAHLVPHPSDLALTYKSASAVPVIPLSEGCVLTLLKQNYGTPEEKMQVLRRLLGRRHHRRKQKRITVSSSKPRCVLDLPLLSRISTFLSNNEATSVDAYAATDTSGDETTAVLSHRESWQGMRWISNVTAPLSRSGHSRVREIPRKRTRSPGDSERNPNQGPAACLSQSEFTGDHSSKQGSNSDSELSSTSSNVGKATSQKAMSGSATLLAESELTQFGSRAFALCRSSFDSAKRFAAGLSNRCSSGTPVDPYAGGSATDGTSNASDSETTNKNIQNNNVGSKHRISRHSACSPREAVAVATPRRQELPPLQLNTMEIAVHLSEASVLLPVNSKCCETSSVLLHGSVNVCRRADDIRDPIEPHGTSKDAESAAGAYEHIQTCDSKGNRQSFWVCGSSSATSAAEEEKAPKEMLQQEEAFWQGTTKFLDNLPDRFCPGVRGVDISLQKAAVTCLRNSIPLHQLGANAVDVSKLGGNLDLRSSRRMRWSTRGGKCGGSPDRQATQPNPEELGSKCLMPGELRCAEGEVGIEPHMRCVRRAALSGHDTSAANTFPLSAPVKNQANSHPNDKLSGTDAHHDESVQPAASVTEVHNNARSICSGLKAQISHVFIPPAARCRRDESGVAQSVTDAAQGGIGDASCNSCEVQHHQNGGSSHERCCCCLTNVGISTGVGVGEGTFGLVCDCCCHHPQEYTALQVCACELELSYLDCLLICRCASEQTMQLEQQQQCQQAQLAAVQRLLHRRAVLEQHLSMEHRLLQGQSMEDDDQTPASQASFSVSFPCSISPEIHRRTHRRLASPTAAAASPARQGKQFISTYPRQRHFSARMPLLRVTLLNDHLDCLQAPLLQLLVLNCRLSQACSLLPPHAMDSPRLCPQEQPQKPQVSSVSLLSASLRLWAFNPFAVAFEPVVESLPLLLVIREAPYSLMRSSYSSCCDDDSLALSVGQSVCRGRRKRMTPRPPLHSFSHGSGRETLMGTASSSPALTPRQQMSSSNNNHSSISSTEKDSGRSVASLLSRLPEDAASRGVRAFENEQQQAFSSSGLAATAPLRKELSLRGRNSEEVSVSSTQIQGSREQFVHLGVEGGSDAPNPVGYASTTEVASSPRRYLGILLSSTDGSSIEANLSPLLLQSVLGSLCKWHCDFTHHLQQQQRQRPRKACGNSSVCEAGARLSQVSHQAVSRQYEQKMPQHEEKEKCAPNHVKSQLRAGHEEGAPEVPGGRRRSLIADTLLLRRLPSRSLDASPICLSPAQDGYPERRHSLGGSLPEGVADGSLDNQLPQQEQRPFREAAGPKRGKLFIPYHVVNQTGLHLGVRLLPTPAALRALDSEGLYGGNAVHATAAGLPPTLRLCRQHNREVGACEEDGSSSDSSSNASEAEGGRALASVPIHWDFGSTLQTVARGPHGAASATTSASNRGTFSCPSSPPTSREEKSIHLEPRGDSSGWDWLLPSEERALTQMRVSIGTASTAHVTLQLAKRTLGGIATEQPLLKNTVPISALQPENWSTDGPDVHGEGSYRRWRLLMPVPLDRVGVYIQPLTDVEATTPTGSAVTTDIQKQTAPFVVCRLVADAGTKQLLVQSQAGKTYSWSRDLSLGMLWQVVDGTEQQKPSGSGASGEAGRGAFKQSFPKTDVLRCCPLIGSSVNKSCLARNPVPDHDEAPKEHRGVDSKKMREPDYHIVVLYRFERLVHSSFSCVQFKVTLEAPLRISSNIPFPVRYRINCPLVLRPGEDPPGDSEGLIQLNEWQQVHSFPLAGVAFLSISLTEGRWSKRTQVHPRPLQKRTPPPTAPKAAVAGASGVLSTTAGGGQTPADCAAGCSSGAGKQESSTESVTGETIVEVECFDSKYRSAKVWVIFCDSDGGSPCLLLHSPVWLVSHVEQFQQLLRQSTSTEKQTRKSPLRFRTSHVVEAFGRTAPETFDYSTLALMPTLCWLQGGCKCCVSTSRASESPETVWSAWSGYSPLCLPGNEWCIRLPSAPSYSSRTILKTHGTHGNSPARSDAPLQCADCEIEDPEGRQERTRQEELLPIPTVEPQELLGAILRRGVSVQNNGNHPTTKRSLPERLTKPAFSASGCSALRLEAAEGPANTVNLTVQVETFDMRDTVSVCNDTPLPLLLRQCFHSDTQEGKGADSSSCQGRTGAQKLGLTEAAAFGVDSVATAVAELWEAAKQGGGLQQHQLSSDVGDSFGHHDPSNVGGHSRPTHLLSMLLEAQQSAEQQKKTKVPTGATPFHSSEAVYISAVPQEEGTHILLDRLIAPAGDILGITHLPPHGAVERNQQGAIRQLNNESSHTSVLLKSTNRPTGSAMSPWAEADTDQVTTSRNDVDVNSLLLIPRYFQLPMVDMDLTAGCSRSQELSSACDGRVPPWSFSSMCKFSGTFVGSYAPDRKAESAAPRTTIPAKADAGNHDAAQPVQPTPDPPTFELRIQVPRLQFSVLSQGAVTDPLSRQTFRLPEELLLVTFEGLSAAYFCSPFHSAAACRIQELQIDSMHSQAYYPVLLQRAPPMPSEAGSATDSDVTQVSRITCSTLKDKGGDSSRSGEPLHASVSKSEDDGGALVEFLLQQRLPFYGSRDDRVVVIDNCSLSLKPVSVRTDLKSVYMASEALSCWQSAWAAATTSMSMHSPEKNSGFPASHGHQRGPEGAPRANNGSSVLRGEGVPSEDEDLEYHYAKQSGLVWACKGNKICQSPLSLFVSHIAGTGLVVVPTRLAVRPWLCKPKAPSLEGQQHTFSQRREQRYIFRLLTIASTCVVLSFKADTGGNSSALRRSVVTLSSLEDARFEVDGLHVTGRRLMDQLKELHQQQQPHVHQDCSRLTKLTRHHRHPALALRDVARVVGHFYQQQLLSHLSKLLVSVDLLGNPALSFAHLQAGVYALAKQPMAAAETGGDVFEGMMKGAEDFLKHTGYGVFGGISRMAGVASDSLGALACDEVYVHSRKQQGRHKARNVEEGLQQGVEALGRALAGGFTGLVEEPVRGAAEGGFEGLLRGAGRGIAGFLVKPLTGVLDLAQKTAEAIKDASQVEGHQRPRFRLPRLLLGDFRLLVAYDAEAAKAKAILTDAEGQYWENLPVLFFALDRRLQALTVLTASNILLFKYYSRSHAELRFLAPISCLLAVGHCSTPNSSTSSGTCSGSRIRSTSSKHRHALVLQLRQEGESGVYYQQLLYSSARLQGHISNSLRQLLLQ
ncbi:LOW QUALITY PROTEIN: uncharacterized protein EMH_0098570 [Eimeria mitis]|uniref:Uncharacterized protein n=1 Tax=Eimeria mitis TaxID=44415 RepID=U6JRQ7_9EIME|nr:LOW QUALITY PROTEIN: uncharacterized protein EMH_0098570 [Eimeria mitis]CDJ28119.1 hypothetical protein, conserved [Eimeria mitis]